MIILIVILIVILLMLIAISIVLGLLLLVDALVPRGRVRVLRQPAVPVLFAILAFRDHYHYYLELLASS